MAGTALTEFYTNTYLKGAKFLSTADLVAERTIHGNPTTFQQISRKAQFCLSGSVVRLTGGDTEASITAMMNAATISMVEQLIRSYDSTATTWTQRGMSFTKQTMTLTGLDVSAITQSGGVRDVCINTNWPALLSAIQNFMTNMVSTTNTGYSRLTGTPQGPNALARTTVPIVNTLDADISGSTIRLFGSQHGATAADLSGVGFLWSTSSMGTVGSGTGITRVDLLTADSFTTTLSTGLVAGTTYYYVAWAKNASGTRYGMERSITYSVAPSVTTGTTIIRTPASLTVEGTITASNGARIIEKGIAWGTTAPGAATIPTLATKAIDVSGNTGSFSLPISGLVPGTTYRFVAYAVNERNQIGVASAVITRFPQPPIVGTITSSNITRSSALLSYVISFISDAPPNECGFYWSTRSFEIPTDIIPFSGEIPLSGISANTTTPGVNRIIASRHNNSVSATISNLPADTHIYVVGYAISSDGNAFSSSIFNFKTNPIIREWSQLGGGLGNTCRALAWGPDGNLYAGGDFTTVNGTTTSALRIARWNGSTWSALGGGLGGTCRALAWGPDGNLYAGGNFTTVNGTTNTSAAYIARWDGTSWSALGDGLDGTCQALVWGPDGNLYAGGDFTTVNGTTTSALRIARWNGTSWSPLGDGLGSTCYALAWDPDGNLYAGGFFITAGGASAIRIARWDGTSWSQLGGGLGNTCFALAWGPDGNLYAGGAFTTAGGITGRNYIARWDGTSWSQLGDGLSSVCFALAWGPDGNLYAGGSFTSADDITGRNRIARWDGTSWSQLGDGLGTTCVALAWDPDGNLYAGGFFTTVNGTTTAALRIAAWTSQL
jgi:hypothetical protein